MCCAECPPHTRSTHAMLLQVTSLLLTAVLAYSAPQRNLFDSIGSDGAPVLGSPISVSRDVATIHEDSETQTRQLGILSPTQVIKTNRVQTNQIDDAGNQFQTPTVIKNDGNAETIERQEQEHPTSVSIDGSKPSSSDDDKLENKNSESGAAIFLNIESSTAELIDEPQNEEVDQNSDNLGSEAPTLVLETRETDNGQLAIDENVLSQMVAMVNALKFNHDVSRASDNRQARRLEHDKNESQSNEGNLKPSTLEDSRKGPAEVTNTEEKSFQYVAPKGEPHFHREESAAEGNILTIEGTSENESSVRKSTEERQRNTNSAETTKSFTTFSEPQSLAEEQTTEPERQSSARINAENVQAEVHDQPQQTQAPDSQVFPPKPTTTNIFSSAAPRGEAHFERKETNHNWDEKFPGIKTKKGQNQNESSSKKTKSFFETTPDETLITSSSSNSRTVKIKPDNWEGKYGGRSAQWPPLMPYNFAFEVRDDETTNYQNRVEVVEDGVLRGSFSFLGADGVIRTVTYTDDGTSGFQIQTQEIPTDVVVVGSQDYKKRRTNWNEFSEVQQKQTTSATASNAYKNEALLSSGLQKSAGTVASKSNLISSSSRNAESRQKDTSTLSQESTGFSTSFSQGKSTTSSTEETTSSTGGSTDETLPTSLGNIHFVSAISTVRNTVAAETEASSTSGSTSGSASIPLEGSRNGLKSSGKADALSSSGGRLEFSSSPEDKSSSKSASVSSGSSLDTSAGTSSSFPQRSTTSTFRDSSLASASSSDGVGKISSSTTSHSNFKTKSEKSFSFRGSSRRQKQGSFIRSKFASALRKSNEDEEESREEYESENEESRESQTLENEEESQEAYESEVEESYEGETNEDEEESREGLGVENENERGRQEVKVEESREGPETDDEKSSREGQEDDSRVELSREQENEGTDEDISTDDETVEGTAEEGSESNVEKSKESKEVENSKKFTVKIPSSKISSSRGTGFVKKLISSTSSTVGQGSQGSEAFISTSDNQDLSDLPGTSLSATSAVSGTGTSIIGKESPVTFIIGSHSLSGDKLTDAIRKSQNLNQGQVSQPAGKLLSDIGPNTPITVILGSKQAGDSSIPTTHGTLAQLSKPSSSSTGSATGTSGSSLVSSTVVETEISPGTAKISSTKQPASSTSKSAASTGVASKTDTSTSVSVTDESLSSKPASSSSSKQSVDGISSSSNSDTTISKKEEGSTSILLSAVSSGRSIPQTPGAGRLTVIRGSTAGQKSTQSSSGQSASSSSASGSSTKSTSPSQSTTLFHPTQSKIVILRPQSFASSAARSSSGRQASILTTNLAPASKSNSLGGTSKTTSASITQGGSEIQSLTKSDISSLLEGVRLSSRKPVFILQNQQTPASNSVLILPAIGGSILKDPGSPSVSTSIDSSSDATKGKTSTIQGASIDTGTQIFTGQQIGQSHGSDISSSSGISGFSLGTASVTSQSPISASRASATQKSSTSSSSLQEFLSGGGSGATKSSVFRLKPASFKENQVISISSGGNLRQVSPISFGGGGRISISGNLNSFIPNFPITVASQPSQGAVISRGNSPKFSTTAVEEDNGFSIVKAKPGFLRVERPLSLSNTQSSDFGNIGQLVVDQGVFGLTPTGNPNQLFITADPGNQFEGLSSVSTVSGSQSGSLSHFKPSISLEQSISRGLRPSVPASIAFGKTFPSFSQRSNFGASQF